ncbi:hypothetical protein CA850_06315 [Micromonospora echinospora]|nr:hypothetical protein CA850_06315 [Micromonospora echinospora]
MDVDNPQGSSVALSEDPSGAGGDAGKKKALLAGLVGVLIFISGIAVGAIIDFDSLGGGSESGQAKESALEAAKERCASRSPFIVVGDGGQTLTVDGQGEEAPGLSFGTIECVLSALETPDSVIAEMKATRALDGRQSGQWGGLKASWSYHPNSGIDLVLTASE